MLFLCVACQIHNLLRALRCFLVSVRSHLVEWMAHLVLPIHSFHANTSSILQSCDSLVICKRGDITKPILPHRLRHQINNWLDKLCLALRELRPLDEHVPHRRLVVVIINLISDYSKDLLEFGLQQLADSYWLINVRLSTLDQRLMFCPIVNHHLLSLARLQQRPFYFCFVLLNDGFCDPIFERSFDTVHPIFVQTVNDWF